MKIFNLLEAPYETTVRTVDAKGASPYMLIPQKMLGKGNFSTVKDYNKDDGHLVKKFSSRPTTKTRKEGFSEFITFLLKNKITNVHMPRVYDIKTINTGDGLKVDTYTIERLIDFEHLDKEELQNCARMVMGDELYQNVLEDHDDPENPDPHAILCVAAQIASDPEDGTIVRFESETFQEACQIVSRAVSSIKNSSADIWAKNLMYRRTGTGIQPVFSDPVYI